MIEPAAKTELNRVGLFVALFGAWALLAILFLGPIDEALHGYYIQEHVPQAQLFFQYGLDKISGQKVVVPVMAIVATCTAIHAVSVRPLVVGFCAQLWFWGTGAVKILFGRDAATLNNGASSKFWNGGFEEHGRWGIGFPSGHATEVIVFYGLIVYMICNYWQLSEKARRWVYIAWGVLIFNCVATSFALGFHWTSDLVGGLLWGSVGLSIIKLLDLVVTSYNSKLPTWLH